MAICKGKVDGANALRYPSMSGGIYNSIVACAVSEVRYVVQVWYSKSIEKPQEVGTKWYMLQELTVSLANIGTTVD